ncbi:MAG: cation:dicarboxylase symporter family transporter, partial [Erysipelotrichaceae bacterium]|nr:cation:dicarboxylase symporter family transporter [Erysipelotrichaceae bacterium]
MNWLLSNSMQITATKENLESAKAFIEQNLTQRDISKEIQSETLMVFDALYRNLLRQGFDQETPITLKITQKQGQIDIHFGFEGKPFVPVKEDAGAVGKEDKILQEYEDKYDYSYQAGYNSVHITVSKSFQHILFLNLASILMAVLVYIPIRVFMPPAAQMKLATEIVLPMIKLFSNAMLMIGAPVTFFSLLKNFTDIYIISERNSVGRRMQIKTIVSSVIAVSLAVLSGFVIAGILHRDLGDLSGAGGLDATPTLPELIESMVPSSIFTPFETIMPFPLIFVAMIVTYAFCSVGKYFDKMKEAVDA